MALEKNITFPSGVVGNYIRIEGETVIDFRNKIFEVEVSIYKDSTTKNKKPIGSRIVKLNEDKFPSTIPTTTDLRDWIYPLIKVELFDGADDV